MTYSRNDVLRETDHEHETRILTLPRDRMRRDGDLSKWEGALAEAEAIMSSLDRSEQSALVSWVLDRYGNR